MQTKILDSYTDPNTMTTFTVGEWVSLKRNLHPRIQKSFARYPELIQLFSGQMQIKNLMEEKFDYLGVETGHTPKWKKKSQIIAEFVYPANCLKATKEIGLGYGENKDIFIWQMEHLTKTCDCSSITLLNCGCRCGEFQRTNNVIRN